MIKKIGVITHYYQSINYGGMLQAYALVRYLRGCGYVAEQICYDSSASQNWPQLIQSFNYSLSSLHLIQDKFSRRIADFFENALFPASSNAFRAYQKKRREVFDSFSRDYIPHSAEVYTEGTIEAVNNIYEAFITGSDQVWNVSSYRPAYFLSFAGPGKARIAYAASMAGESVPDALRENVMQNLKGYVGISLRETSAIPVVRSLTTVEPVITVDPTLLLDRCQWEKIVSDRVVVPSDYIFCYFLGNNLAAKKFAEDFSNKVGLTLLCIPMYTSTKQFREESFLGYIVNDASPRDFLAFIRDAQYILTDSYHAVIFSMIFQKNFLVFDRNQNRTMSTRITHLLELCGLRSRYISDANFGGLQEILQSVPKIYAEQQMPLADLIAFSKQYLREMLHRAETSQK